MVFPEEQAFPAEHILREAFCLAHIIFPGGGTCLEFGVGGGRSYSWQAEQILNIYPSSKLIGFDSWQGLPEETKGVWKPDRHSVGAFSYPKTYVKQRLEKLGLKDSDPRFRFIDGFFSENLTKELQFSISNLIFVNIDVDIHKSTLYVLDFIKPLLREGVIIYFDDWKDPRDTFDGEWGEHLAWKQWSLSNPNIMVETLKVNKFNQRYMKITKV